jgi:hypothetical protein
MAETEHEGLRLEAQDADDLGVMAAVLQDAVTRLGEMSYSGRAHRFAAVFNRFRWEHEPGEGANRGSPANPDHQRVRAGLHFDGVLSAQISGLDPSNPDQILELLTIACEPRDGGAASITLVFAGAGLVRLEAECIDCHLRDLGAPWPTPRVPSHEELGEG